MKNATATSTVVNNSTTAIKINITCKPEKSPENEDSLSISELTEIGPNSSADVPIICKGGDSIVISVWSAIRNGGISKNYIIIDEKNNSDIIDSSFSNYRIVTKGSKNKNGLAVGVYSVQSKMWIYVLIGLVVAILLTAFINLSKFNK